MILELWLNFLLIQMESEPVFQSSVRWMTVSSSSGCRRSSNTHPTWRTVGVGGNARPPMLLTAPDRRATPQPPLLQNAPELPTTPPSLWLLTAPDCRATPQPPLLQNAPELPATPPSLWLLTAPERQAPPPRRKNDWKFYWNFRVFIPRYNCTDFGRADVCLATSATRRRGDVGSLLYRLGDVVFGRQGWVRLRLKYDISRHTF